MHHGRPGGQPGAPRGPLSAGGCGSPAALLPPSLQRAADAPWVLPAILAAALLCCCMCCAKGCYRLQACIRYRKDSVVGVDVKVDAPFCELEHSALLDSNPTTTVSF